jgi:hypothetical protein
MTISTLELQEARDEVQRVHARYAREVIEALNICPFARRSREQGRVHRPLYFSHEGSPRAQRVAEELADLVRTHADAEIVLLTFPTGSSHEFWQTEAFEAFLLRLRESWQSEARRPPWYMVSFHPLFGVHDEDRLTQDSLVPLLRRSPDPVIQCVNARTLDRVRQEAQAVAHKRMVDHLMATQPELVPLFERSVPTDHELSADVARHNFDHYAKGEGRAKLEALLDDIHRDRERGYAKLSTELGLAR